MTEPYQPTAFEQKVLRVLLEHDPNQDRGLPPAFIARHVWKPLSSTAKRAGQNQAMGAQLQRMWNLGLVCRGQGDGWFLTDKGMQYAGKR